MTTDEKQQRFLVISAQGLGDSLEATPMLRALRAAHPRAVIDVAVTRDGPRELFGSLEGYVDGVHYLPFWERGFAAFARSLAAVRLRVPAYDASFLSYPSARGAYDLLALGFAAKRRFAHAQGRALMRPPLFGARLVPVRSAHNVERNRDLLRAAGIAPGQEQGYVVPAAWIDGSTRPRRIAMHVGTIAHAELANKRWPLEHFTELARRLVQTYEEVTLVAGPAEREESHRLAASVPQVRLFEGTLPQVARHLSTCAAVVANDSGIAHLAAGVGAPAITLFGPTPLDFRPYSDTSVALRPSDCPPCFDVRRPIVRCVRNIGFRCLNVDLPVDLVERTIQDVVARQAVHR